MANLDSLQVIVPPRLLVSNKLDTIPDSYTESFAPLAPNEPSDWRMDYRRSIRPVRKWYCPFIYLPFLYAYAFLGAWIFMMTEASSIKDLKDETDCIDKKPFTNLVYDGVPYAISVFTTVGYGNQAPVSVAGRLLTILYAIIGIPLYFAFAADFQDWMDQAIFVWLRKLVCRKRFQQNQHIARWKKFVVMLIVYLVYMFLQGFITMLVENSHKYCDKDKPKWNYLDAIYFVFQSAALIGFGDMMTTRSFYLTVHLPMLTIGQVLLTGLFTAMIKYIRYKFPKWTCLFWNWMIAKIRKNCKSEKKKKKSRKGRKSKDKTKEKKSSEERPKLKDYNELSLLNRNRSKFSTNSSDEALTAKEGVRF